jgi:hypothetical protein
VIKLTLTKTEARLIELLLGDALVFYRRDPGYLTENEAKLAQALLKELKGK